MTKDMSVTLTPPSPSAAPGDDVPAINAGERQGGRVIGSLQPGP